MWDWGIDRKKQEGEFLRMVVPHSPNEIQYEDEGYSKW